MFRKAKSLQFEVLFPGKIILLCNHRAEIKANIFQNIAVLVRLCLLNLRNKTLSLILLLDKYTNIVFF